MEKKIVIFTDLEGTLLREEDGQYSEDEMFLFLDQISKLEELEGAKANIHIVSPMFIDQIQRILEQLDKTIIKYNEAKGKKLSMVVTASATEQESNFLMGHKSYSSRIMPLEYDYDLLRSGLYGYEKLEYVTSRLREYRKGDIKRRIYLGNGRNDILSMKEIKKTPNGTVICPNNSRRDVKAIADYTSDKTDLSGVTEGFSKLCQVIEQQQEENKKAQEDPDDWDR